jgi:hypothetical protein
MRYARVGICWFGLMSGLSVGCASDIATDDDPDVLTDEELKGPDATAFRTAKSELRDVENALREMDENHARLNGELRKLGPALTAKQREDYQRKFYEQADVKEDARKVDQQAEQAEKAVNALTKNEALLKKIMKGSPALNASEVAAKKEDIYDAYKTLAKTSSSDGACVFGNAILSGDAKYAGLASKKSKVEQEIVVPACTRKFVYKLAEGKTVEIALSEFASVGGEVYGAAKEVAKHLKGEQVTQPPSQIARFHSALNAAASLYGAGAEAANGNYKQALLDIAKDSPTLIQGAADAASVYRVVVRGGKPLADISKFTGALSGGIQLFTSTIAIANDLEDLDDKSDKFRLAGDLVGAAGGALVLVGAAAGITVPVLALSSAIALAARWLAAKELNDAEKKDRNFILPKLGLPESVKNTLLKPNTTAIKNLTAAGFTPEQFQSVMNQSSTVLSSEYGNSGINVPTRDFSGFPRLIKTLRWEKTSNAFDLVMKLLTNGDGLSNVRWVLFWTDGNQRISDGRAAYVAFLDDEAKRYGFTTDDRAFPYATLRSFVADK